MKIIDIFICKLRKKLALAGADNVIGTVWGRCYMVRDQPALVSPGSVVARNFNTDRSDADDMLEQLSAA